MRRITTAVIGLFLVLLVVGTGCDVYNTTTYKSPTLGGKQFNEIFSCSETPLKGNAFCADDNAADVLVFTSLGNGSYQVRDVPDTGFLYTGTLSGSVFTWTATSPSRTARVGGVSPYTESGTWTFNSSFTSFSGSSTYQAVNDSYSGECNETGALLPDTPPNPIPAGACD